MNPTELRTVLEENLAAAVVPPGDPGRAVAEGRHLRRRRRQLGALAVASVVLLIAGGIALLQGGSPTTDSTRIDPVGRMDFSEGLRAYADPGVEIHLGGRTFPAGTLDFLDTDATATPYGVVFYDDGVPKLLDESGRVDDLEPGADTADHHPTAKVDSQRPFVAYGTTTDGTAEVVVRDLASDEVVARHEVANSTVIDGIDAGVVFLRTDEGTSVWDSTTGDEKSLAGRRTRVADVRNGVLLYDGPSPDGPAATSYRLVKGAIDAQLTYDGAYLLSWSNRLESTEGGAPVVLDDGRTGAGPGYGFWAVDTDGSILWAVPGGRSSSTVFDCDVPSGRCTELGPLSTRGGDPEFIGVDM